MASRRNFSFINKYSIKIIFFYNFLLEFQEKIKSQRQIGFFAQIPLFEGFPQHVIQMFYRSMQNLSFAKDSIIFQQGDLCDSLYFIQNGEIEVLEII